MAELLIKAVDAIHIDPLTNARGCYKRGDVIDIREDGFKWGREEGPPIFYIIKIAGLTVKDAQKYREVQVDERGETVARRLYKIKLDDMTSAMKADLSSVGKVESTKEVMTTYIASKAVASVRG